MGQVNFLGIGAQKAGTTWLHSALRLHPDISLHPLKELHFFDSKYSVGGLFNIEKQRQRALIRLKKKLNHINQIEELDQALNKKVLIKTFYKLAFEEYSFDTYFSIFEDLNEKIVGEITPGYACIHEEGIREIRENLGDVKLIYMIRNPVSRAWSQFRMEEKNKIEKKANLDELALLNMVQDKEFLERSDERTNYRKTINLYDQYFTKIHFIFYDDLCKEPLKVLQTACEFLEVDYQPDFFLKVIGTRSNEGIKLAMPDKVKDFLSTRYQEQIDFIKDKFNQTLVY